MEARTVVTSYAGFQVSRRRVVIDPTHDIDMAEIRPFQTASFVPDPYVLADGYPITVPYLIKAEASVSSSGEYLLSSRPSPQELTLPGVHTRFLSVEGWDDVSGIWQPSVTKGVDWSWISDPLAQPDIISDYTYRIGKEIFRLPVLHFDTGDYLVSNFNNNVDDAAEFSVVIVAALEMPVGYGMFSTTYAENGYGIWIDEAFQVKYGTRSASLTEGVVNPTQMLPVYLVLSVRPPQATLYVCGGPQNVLSASINSNVTAASSLQFNLGKMFSGEALGSMNLMEVSFYNYAVSTRKDGSRNPDPNRPNLYQIIGEMSTAYGAKS